MRFDDLNAILNSTLEPLERLVLVAVASHINQDGNQAWPSLERLAEMTGMGRSTVQRHMRSLKERGVVTVRRRFSASSVYSIANIPQKSQCGTSVAAQSLQSGTSAGAISSEVPERDVQKSRSGTLINQGTNQGNIPLQTRPDPRPDDLDLFNDQPSRPMTDRQLIQGLSGYAIWAAKDPDRMAENIAEAASLVREHGAAVVLDAARALSLAIGGKVYPSQLSEHFIAIRAQERLTKAPPERYVDPVIAKALSILDTMGYAKASGCYDHGRKSEDQFREMLEHNQGAALEFIAATDGVTA